MPSSEPRPRPPRARRWALLGLVLGLLWWGYAWGTWPLAWSMALLPSLKQGEQGITALVYPWPPPTRKPQSSLSLGDSQGFLPKPDTLMRAYGFWLVPRDGEYLMRLTCDDAGRLKLDGRTLLRLEGVSADNHGEISLPLRAGPHFLEVELINLPGTGFFRLEVQAPGAQGLSLIGAADLRRSGLGNYHIWNKVISGAEALRGWGLGGLACLVILLGLGRAWLSGKPALWICLTVTLAGALADVYLDRGLTMTQAACRQSSVLSELRNLDRYLRSPAHQEAQRQKAGLVLLGDSGHILYPGSHDHLLYVMGDMIKEQGRADQVELYGAAHPGFHAYDFYFLLNRVAPQRPRLVIIPINVRTFGNISRKYWFDELYGLIQWGELCRPAGLSSQNRPLPWGTLLAAKLGASFLDGHGLPFVQVAHHRFKAARDQLEQGYRREFTQFSGWERWMGPPRERAQNLGAEWSEVTAEHYLLPVFRRINSLAAANGIKVLYYAVPMNPGTRYLRPNFIRDSFAVIASQVSDPPHAFFLDLSTLALDQRAFVDGLEHFTPPGKTRIAQALLEAAWPLLEEGKAQGKGR